MFKKTLTNRQKLGLIFIVIMGILFFLFLYSGFTYAKSLSDIGVWSGVKFKMMPLSKIAGTLFIVGIPIYLLLYKKIK